MNRTTLILLGAALTAPVVQLPAQTTPQPEACAPAALGEVRWVHGVAADQKRPGFVLWLAYGSVAGELADHRQYLADLQRRLHEQGVRIAVALPPADAGKLAAASPPFAVAALPAAVESVATGLWLVDDHGGEVWAWPTIDGAVDLLQAAIDGTLGKLPVAELADLVPSLLERVGDGGDLLDAARHCAESLPRCGRAQALMVLVHWWCTGDVAAAHKAAKDGLQSLAGEAVPLTVFADLVLRGDRNDPELARLLAVSLAPAAAAAPEGAFTQLVYLRALLRSGQDRLAGRLAATLPKLLAERPELQVVFAETLMEAKEPAVHKDLAERALAAASGKVDPRWQYGARHKVLARTGAPAADVEALLSEYRATEAFSNYGLNNDAWYLMTQQATMGRFDTLALAHCEEMQRQYGGGISYGNKDTVALSMFLNGRLQEALDLQTDATTQSGGDPEYIGRRARFQNTLTAGKPPAEPPRK